MGNMTRDELGDIRRRVFMPHNIFIRRYSILLSVWPHLVTAVVVLLSHHPAAVVCCCSRKPSVVAGHCTHHSLTLQCGLRPSRHQHWAEQGRADWATPAMSPPPVTTDIRGLWGQTSAFMGRGSVKRQQSDNPDDHVWALYHVIAMFSPPLLPGPGLGGPGWWALYSLCRPLTGPHLQISSVSSVCRVRPTLRLGCVCCLCLPLHVPHNPCYIRMYICMYIIQV